MRSRTLIFIFVIATSFYLVFKNSKELTEFASDFNTAQASKDCSTWLPVELWIFMNSGEIPFTRIKEKNFYLYTDFEQNLMLSQSENSSRAAWLNNANVYVASRTSFSYAVIEKKYDNPEIPLQNRILGTLPYGHWEFLKSSSGMWVAAAKVKYENPLYKKSIQCIEDQECTWRSDQTYERSLLKESPELIKSLQSEGLLSVNEYELMETFCSHIDQNYIQKKMDKAYSEFETQCSLKMKSLSLKDLQGLCEKIRSKFIPTLKTLEATHSLAEPVAPAESKTNAEQDSKESEQQ